MIDLSPSHTCELICPVDASALARWVQSPEGRAAPWIVQPDTERKPARLMRPPAMTWAIAEQVLMGMEDVPKPDRLTLAFTEIHLSRMMPGQAHGMHWDQQYHTGRDWLTRVHVPVLTNRKAWFLFEESHTDPPLPSAWRCRFSMPAGHAYTFNALRRHDFGNVGDTPRVHLIFDVVRAV